MKTKILAIVALITQLTIAQQSSQNIEMNIDRLGNADLKVSMKMTAQQWQMWNSNFGNNPAALKREMERSMPGYFLDDFKLEKQDMKRSFELTLKAYGVCKIDKRGNWSLDTDEKDANLTELTEHKYMLVSSPPEFGGQLQQTFIVNFPEEASEIEVDDDSYGRKVFEFKMEEPSTGSNILQWVGILFVLVSGGWAGKIKWLGGSKKENQ